MGQIIYIESERFGSVTRDTMQPHPVERLVSWLRKAAPIRAKASLGCEDSLALAPNVLPLSRKQSKSEAMASAVADYCHRMRYSGWIVSDAISLGMLRMRHGSSVASAIASAKARADFASQHGRGPGDLA
jgi:hypothetical protein